MNSINEMTENLREKRNKLMDILEITKLQIEIIDKQDMDLLGQLIDRKQAVIDKIDALDEQFLQSFNTVKAQLGVSSMSEISNNGREEFKEIKAEIAENHKIIEEIISIEKENSTKIKKQYTDIKSKIKEISGGKKLISAYGNEPILNDGVFIDKKK